MSTTPFRSITLNQEGEERLRWLTDEEEARLVAIAAPWLREIILVGLDTGLRRSNLVGLQWSWLHEEGTVLLVPRQQVKAKKATVMIPLTTRAASIIQRQVRHVATSHVFTQPDGRPYGVDQVGMAMIRAAKQGWISGSQLAHAPAYVYQPVGASRAAAAGGRIERRGVPGHHAVVPDAPGAGRLLRLQDQDRAGLGADEQCADAL